jgi:tetratricopeptide (TPR) repeat protein
MFESAAGFLVFLANIGRQIEHYHEVVTLNHAFPMAHNFTGNVYNDWGSQINGESMNARQRGDIEEAVRLRQKSQDMWNKAEEAYTNTKKLAPNYVQTHHQMGLLFVKRAEQANAWGEAALAHEMYQKALAEFYRYKMLDPVFLANYDRIVQILLMDGKIDESIALYKEALYYNKDVEFKIKNAITLPDRVAAVSMSLAKLYFNEVAHLPSAFNPPVPQAEEAIKYFKLAVENDPKNVEAWKGLGFLLEKCGRNPEAQIAYQHALQLAPNDPDMKRK